MKKMNKKDELKKLRLSRETLHILTSSDSQKVLGGAVSTTCGMSPVETVC
jgi:hypothetical protein